jgi:hypothetical protein
MSQDANQFVRRAIRDGFLRVSTTEHFPELATDSALERLSAARNLASKSGNLFMLVSALVSALYFLKIYGIAGEIRIGDYKLSDLPFGNFVLCSAALALSCVSLVRAGDSRSHDRLLRLACEQRHPDSSVIAYQLFPNENAWGKPLNIMVFSANGGGIFKFFRSISLTSINLFILFLVIFPSLCGVDFLAHKRYVYEKEFKDLLCYFVIFLLISDLSSFILTAWANVADRD